MTDILPILQVFSPTKNGEIFKEFQRIEVDVYIAEYDDNVFSQLERCGFFNDAIKTDLCFLTIHDAVLHIQKQKKSCSNSSVLDMTSQVQESSQVVELKKIKEQKPSVSAKSAGREV